MAGLKGSGYSGSLTNTSSYVANHIVLSINRPTLVSSIEVIVLAIPFLPIGRGQSFTVCPLLRSSQSKVKPGANWSSFFTSDSSKHALSGAMLIGDPW